MTEVYDVAHRHVTKQDWRINVFANYTGKQFTVLGIYIVHVAIKPKLSIVLFLQVTCSTEGVYVFYIQSTIHQQLHRDTRVPNSTGNCFRVTYGCQLLRLLNKINIYIYLVCSHSVIGAKVHVISTCKDKYT